jgi:hypothetical protein|tara:strand:- start:239 stop:472 length:234 start_codon:yes stop_codon:yes gene_type:complete
MNIDLPWRIGDNDINSKSIKAWSDRQQTSAELASNSAVRRAASDKLFNEYVTEQINETLEYNALYDAITAYELDLLA